MAQALSQSFLHGFAFREWVRVAGRSKFVLGAFQSVEFVLWDVDEEDATAPEERVMALDGWPVDGSA